MARALVERRASSSRCSSTRRSSVAEERDPKGLYTKARARRARRTSPGIDSPYEPPEEPEVHLPMADLEPEQAAERVVAALRERGLLERL